MKKLLFFSLFVVMGMMVMAQQPGNAQVAGSVAAPTAKQASNDKIHTTPEDRVLKAGEANVVKFAVDGVADKQLIVKVVSEETCDGKRGEKFGEYVFTPKVKEGKVLVRITMMDFMGAVMKLGDVEFDIKAE